MILPQLAVVEGSVSGVEVDVNEARRRQLAKKQREKRGRGLSLVAGEIVDKFNKVAISKQKVQAKEQVHPWCLVCMALHIACGYDVHESQYSIYL